MNAGPPQKVSLVVKRSIKIAGHQTSVSLEEAFWNALKEIATSKNTPVPNLVSAIDKGRTGAQQLIVGDPRVRSQLL
jgi:predicted DNA-binding ribbon-helix-helix protein